MNIWAELKGILGELEETGFTMKSPEGAETLSMLLEVAVSGQFCKKCGAGPLMRFEILNQNRCEECRLRDLSRWRAEDLAKAETARLAR